MDVCGNETPLSFLLSRQKMDERWIVAHRMIYEDDFDRWCAPEIPCRALSAQPHFFGHTIRNAETAFTGF
jgi:hypothetical protein